MALPDAIRVLAEQWEEVWSALDDDDHRRLADLVWQFAERADQPASLEGPALAIVELCAAALPPGHPVLRALFADTQTRLSQSPTNWRQVAHLLTSRLDRVAPAAALAPRPPGPAEPADEVRDQAEQWLLAAAALSPAQVRGRGQNPDRPELIRLERPDGRQQLPAFQFDAEGQPIPLVLTVNRLLDADDDPWGVADWWLGPNAWLRAVPAELLGRVDDAVLIATAQAVSREE